MTIDFAYLEAKERVGTGSTAAVYRGQYKGAPVAIKMSTPNDITPEVCVYIYRVYIGVAYRWCI